MFLKEASIKSHDNGLLCGCLTVSIYLSTNNTFCAKIIHWGRRRNHFGIWLHTFSSFIYWAHQRKHKDHSSLYRPKTTTKCAISDSTIFPSNLFVKIKLHFFKHKITEKLITTKWMKIIMVDFWLVAILELDVKNVL